MIRSAIAIAFVCLIWPILSTPCSAELVDSLEIVVDEELARELNFEVYVFDDDLKRSGYLDIYVAIPPSYRESSLRGVTLEIGREGQRVVDANLQTQELEEYRGLTDFFGVSFRLYDRGLDRLNLQIFYGRGEVLTDQLAFPVLEFMPEE